MKDFLKGLLALPLVLIGGFTVYWVAAILFAVVGGVIGLVVVLAPYVLRFVGIVLIIVSRFGALENWSHVPSAVQKMSNSECRKRPSCGIMQNVWLGRKERENETDVQRTDKA